MEFGLALITSVGSSGIEILTSTSDALAEFFAPRQYGSALGTIAVGIICVEKEFEPQFPGTTRFIRSQKLLEYDIKLDLESFRNADDSEARRILGSAILNSLSVMEGMKLGDFDLYRFAEDLRGFLERRGWLFGTEAGVRPHRIPENTVGSLDTSEGELPVPLAEDSFWSIIDESRAKSAPYVDIPQQCESISEILSPKSEDQIVAFELTLRDLIRQANHFNVMAACKICEGHVSDDNYLYFRAGLISFGRDIYYGALEDPDACAEALALNTKGESVLYTADNALLKKFGRDTDKTLPRERASEYYNYDLGMEEPAGEDWTEEELPHKYPRLWQAAKEFPGRYTN
jgi:hypothetical protein